MLSESFSVGHSQIHRLDPRLKVVFATLYAFLVAISDAFATLIVAVALSCLFVALARLNAFEVGKRLAVVNGLIFFLWLVVPATFEGEPLFVLGPVDFTREGILICTRITLKSNAIILAMMAWISSASIATLGHAMSRLRIPGKIVYLLLLTYRYIFVLEQEYQRLLRAAKSRGFRPGTNMHTYRTYAYMVGMLFVRASVRAEKVYQAMLCRGFRSEFYSLQEFSFSRADWIWFVFMVLAIVGLGILEWIKTVHS